MAGERPSYFAANFSDLEVLTSDMIQADMRLDSVYYCTDSRERSNKQYKLTQIQFRLVKITARGIKSKQIVQLGSYGIASENDICETW